MLRLSRSAILWGVWTISAAFATGIGAAAQKAEIKSTAPAFIAAGQTVSVTVYGENLTSKSASALHGAAARLMDVGPTDAKMKSRGARKATVEVTVPAASPREMLDLTLVQADGSKATTQIAIVDPVTTETVVKKPAGTFSQAMPVVGTSVAISGQLDGDTPDDFRLDAKAGEVWRICCTAGRMGSLMDPVIRVRNQQHISLAISAGDKKKDRVITFKAPSDGPFYIELTEAEAKGGDGYTYRVAIIRQ